MNLELRRAVIDTVLNLSAPVASPVERWGTSPTRADAFPGELGASVQDALRNAPRLHDDVYYVRLTSADAAALRAWCLAAAEKMAGQETHDAKTVAMLRDVADRVIREPS